MTLSNLRSPSIETYELMIAH